ILAPSPASRNNSDRLTNWPWSGPGSLRSKPIGRSLGPISGVFMRAIVFDQFGEPADVLRGREVPTPEPGPGAVRGRMLVSQINPSDLLVVRGRYVVLPRLPAIPGFEGAGVVDKLGPGLNLLGRLVLGKRVLAINQKGGNWAEYAVIPSRQARPLP